MPFVWATQTFSCRVGDQIVVGALPSPQYRHAAMQNWYVLMSMPGNHFPSSVFEVVRNNQRIIPQHESMSTLIMGNDGGEAGAQQPIAAPALIIQNRETR